MATATEYSFLVVTSYSGGPIVIPDLDAGDTIIELSIYGAAVQMNTQVENLEFAIVLPIPGQAIPIRGQRSGSVSNGDAPALPDEIAGGTFKTLVLGGDAKRFFADNPQDVTVAYAVAT